jgi:hypothetical protein
MSPPDEDRIERPIRPADLRRNPHGRWLRWGALIGGVVGAGAGVASVLSGAVGLIHIAETVAVLTFLGVGLGIVVAVLYHTFRPVLVALFASPETFRDEYDTPEEQGRIRSSVGDRIAPRLPSEPGGQPSRVPPRDRQDHLRPRGDLTRPSEEV